VIWHETASAWMSIASRSLTRVHRYCLKAVCSAMLHSPLVPISLDHSLSWSPSSEISPEKNDMFKEEKIK